MYPKVYIVSSQGPSAERWNEDAIDAKVATIIEASACARKMPVRLSSIQALYPFAQPIRS